MRTYPYGQTRATACAAYFNPSTPLPAPYMHMYDCNLARTFICELGEPFQPVAAAADVVAHDDNMPVMVSP